MNPRASFINRIIEEKKYRSYLEIGCANCETFNAIVCEHKIPVDPKLNFTSDEFFKYNCGRFDIVFVDGLHLAEQAERDILNSLDILNDGGTIVVHDTNPLKEEWTLEKKISDVWTGDVWKAIYHLRKRDDLTFSTYMDHFGLTVIRRGSSVPINLSSKYMNFSFFEKNREIILNS